MARDNLLQIFVWSGTMGPSKFKERKNFFCWFTALTQDCKAINHEHPPSDWIVMSNFCPSRLLTDISLSSKNFRTSPRNAVKFCYKIPWLKEDHAMMRFRISELLTFTTSECCWWPFLGTESGLIAQRARRPRQWHADKLPGLRLSAGLMAHPTPLPGSVCSPAPRAQSSPKHRHSLTPSFIHRLENSIYLYKERLVCPPVPTLFQSTLFLQKVPLECIRLDSMAADIIPHPQ